jgi:IS5 family transposase
MRKKWRSQMDIIPLANDHPQARELEAISNIIHSHPHVCEHILCDLKKKNTSSSSNGAEGMSAEQVLRCAIVKTLYSFSYAALAFHIVDSQSLRRFCMIGIADKGFKKSTLNNNIKAISPDTWEKINRDILGHARDTSVEKGRTIRVDCTGVESNIHEPSDSTLLWDSVRVMIRLVERCRDLGLRIPDFSNHCRRTKRRMLEIMNAKTKSQRKSAYADLLKMTGKVLGYGHAAMDAIAHSPSADLLLMALSYQIEEYARLTEKVMDQTRRRVMLEEHVPSKEKIVSIFEPHTDIVIKDNRDVVYGHKICLTGGASNLILDCVVLEGNPNDATLVETMLDRQKEIYKRYPLKASFDGGFASKANLRGARTRGVKDVCFAKKRGLKETDMCRSEYVYHRLRNFRAGIESGISWLKRCMGLTRCTWKGWESFKSYVWSSIVAANLLTLARVKPATG